MKVLKKQERPVWKKTYLTHLFFDFNCLNILNVNQRTDHNLVFLFFLMSSVKKNKKNDHSVVNTPVLKTVIVII